MEEFDMKMPVGMRFSIIHRSFRRQMDEHLRNLDITGPQLGILGRLHYLETYVGGEINQRDIENATHLSHTTVTEMLKRLESKGFIETSPSRVDKRSKCISSTRKASALHEELDRLDREVFARLCEGLTDAQRENIQPVMNVMINNAIKMVGKEGIEEK